ncbi:hypothetical protein EJ06DRAFT_524959 [Trichodelitschia bisporula]|uniref:Uncharacterized protein n=1 Tax=Trichodelitschia bisporula TaxID=703511 RepID=A0A6G1HK51_9PEZI|nr:hypothetical protein EJ06DRAFT_524959 [Trichodelitschia bisporula]
MSTECTVISASLSHVQSLVLKIPKDRSAKLQALHSTLETALAGCMVAVTVLEQELEKLVPADEVNWLARAKLAWQDEKMKELLAQLHGQQSSLTLLTQLLSLESLAAVEEGVKDTANIVAEMRSRTAQIRISNPDVRAPGSIFEVDSDVRTITRARNRASFAQNSVIGSSIFEFDDEVVDPLVYRKALMAARQQPQSEHNLLKSELRQPVSTTKSRRRQQPELGAKLRGIAESGTTFIDLFRERTAPKDRPSPKSKRLFVFQDKAPPDPSRDERLKKLLSESKRIADIAVARRDLIYKIQEHAKGDRPYVIQVLMQDPQAKEILDINSPDIPYDKDIIERGGTMLHQAIWMSDFDLVDTLLTCGADPFRRDADGNLPTAMATDEERVIYWESACCNAAAAIGPVMHKLLEHMSDTLRKG